MSKILVVIFMGTALLVLCVKFFCCRRHMISENEVSDHSHDPDEADKAELTRISPTSDSRKPQTQGDYSPVRGQEALEVSKDIEEDDNQQ